MWSRGNACWRLPHRTIRALPALADLPLPPCPTGLPMLRQSLAFARGPIPFFVQQYQLHGPAFALKAFDFNLTVMIGAAAHRAIFVDQAHKLSARAGYGVLLNVLNDALPVADGAAHARQRRLIQPAFHSRRIEGYLDIMREAADEAMRDWKDGDAIDATAVAQRMTLNVVVRALTGMALGARRAAFAAALHNAFDYATQPNIRKIFKFDLAFHPYGRFLRAKKHLDDFLYALIRERRAEINGSSAGQSTAQQSRDDVLSWLIEARDEDGSQFSDENVRDQILFLVYAGHDTATAALSWMLYELARNHAIAARLRDVRRNSRR